MQSGPCPKCGAAMAEGFINDVGYGTRLPSNWVEGAPVRSIWTGVKLKGRAQYQIAAFRCNRCGFLENYAR